MAGRALHVMRMSGVSGSENHLLALIPGLRDLGWRCDVIIPTPDPTALSGYADMLGDSADAVEVVRQRVDVDPGLTKRLRHALKSGRYDLAHAHLAHADLHLALAAAGTPVPLVSTKHNHDRFRARQPFRLVETLSARRYSAIIAISRSLADATAQWTGAPVSTVPYGLDAGPEPGRRDGFHRPVTLLAVGRLERQKGVDVLLRAMRCIIDARSPVRLVIAGDGGQAPKLRELSSTLGLDDHVEFLGQRSDIEALMHRADILVHTARWEGFGLVLLEAMRAGLPIVATRVGGIPEVVADGETALLVEPDAPRSFADAVLRLIDDEQAALAFGRAGRRRLEHEFSPRTMATRTADIYAAVTGATADSTADVPVASHRS